jgi:hypothetical protein
LVDLHGDIIDMWWGKPDDRCGYAAFSFWGRRKGHAIKLAKRKYHTLEEAARFESGPIDEKAYLEKLRLQKRGLVEDLLTGRVRVNGGGEGNVA